MVLARPSDERASSVSSRGDTVVGWAACRAMPVGPLLMAGVLTRSLLIDCAGVDDEIARPRSWPRGRSRGRAASRSPRLIDGGLACLHRSPDDRDPACRARPASRAHT